LSATIASFLRYPVKGLHGQNLPHVSLIADHGLPLDRVYAIENGGARFDRESPKWLPKSAFLMLMRHERLAALTFTLDEADHTLTLFRNGAQIAKGCLKTKIGRQLIEQFLAAYLKEELKGPPRIVSAEGHSFTDIAAKALHLVNLETVREVSRAAGIELDPLRFRANLYFEGLPAWEERNWVGKTILCGQAVLKVFNETGRCEATSVDPRTAQRGMSVPAALQRIWGHTSLGVYATVTRDGHAKTGDRITVQT
jgi:uncharacterized protein YcbX